METLPAVSPAMRTSFFESEARLLTESSSKHAQRKYPGNDMQVANGTRKNSHIYIYIYIYTHLRIRSVDAPKDDATAVGRDDGRTFRSEATLSAPMRQTEQLKNRLQSTKKKQKNKVLIVIYNACKINRELTYLTVKRSVGAVSRGDSSNSFDLNAKPTLTASALYINRI